MASLKPCPFCGHPAELEKDGRFAWVQCVECNNRTAGWTSGEGPSARTAVKYWNRRIGESTDDD